MRGIAVAAASLCVICASAAAGEAARAGAGARKGGLRQGQMQGFFGSLLGGSSSSSPSSSSSSAQSAAKADTCCTVCPAAFPVELQLLELDEETADRALRRFHAWFTRSKAAGRRGFEHPHVSLLELSEMASTKHEASASARQGFFGAAASLLGGSSTSSSSSSAAPVAVGADPDSAEMSMTFDGQKCCSVCPTDFIQPGAQLESVLLETGTGFLGGLMGGSGGDDKEEATSAVPCCEVCPSQLYPPNDLESAMNPSFLQTGFLGGLLGGSSGGASQAGAGAGAHTCCRVCEEQLEEEDGGAGAALTPGKEKPKASGGGGILGGLFGGSSSSSSSAGGDVDLSGYAPPRNPANQRKDYQGQ